jgi:hypothetical protein
MRLIEILTRQRSIHPFFVGVFFLGAVAMCWLGPKDDPVHVKSVIQDSQRVVEQGERLQEAVSRKDWQAVAKVSAQMKQEQETKQRQQSKQDALKPTWMRAKQIASIVSAICFILISLSYFLQGFRGQSSGDQHRSDTHA